MNVKKLQLYTFSTTHSAAEKIRPMTAKVLALLKLLLPICFAVYTICCLAVISSAIIGLSKAPKNSPISTPRPPPVKCKEY